MPKEALQCIKTIKKDQKTSKKGQKTIKACFKGAFWQKYPQKRHF